MVSFSLGIEQSGFAGLNGNSVFNFLKNQQAVFPKWLHHFTVPSAGCEVPVSLHTLYYMLLLSFF